MKDKTIPQNEVSHFVVTGLLYRKKTRFSHTYMNYWHVMEINLWRGSVWAVMKKDGKRRLIKRVIN